MMYLNYVVTLKMVLFQGEPGFILAHQLIRRALDIPGASVHWYDKPGKEVLSSYKTLVSFDIFLT